MSAPFLGLALLQFYNVSIMLKQPCEKKNIVLRLAPHFVFGGNDLEIGKNMVLRLHLLFSGDNIFVFSGGNDLEIVLCKVPSL